MTAFRSEGPGAALAPLPTESKGRIYVYTGMTFAQAVAAIEAERSAQAGKESA